LFKKIWLNIEQDINALVLKRNTPQSENEQKCYFHHLKAVLVNNYPNYVFLKIWVGVY